MRIPDDARRAFLTLLPAALTVRFLPAQVRPSLDSGGPGPTPPPPPAIPNIPRDRGDPRLPNGQDQKNAIAAEDYAKNLRDAFALVDLARSFEADIEKANIFIVSRDSLGKLDKIDKTTRRIRGRLKHKDTTF